MEGSTPVWHLTSENLIWSRVLGKTHCVCCQVKKHRIPPLARLTIHFPLSSVVSPLANRDFNWGKDSTHTHTHQKLPTWAIHLLREKTPPQNFQLLYRPVCTEKSAQFSLLQATGWLRPRPFSLAPQPCLQPACHTSKKTPTKTGFKHSYCVKKKTISVCDSSYFTHRSFTNTVGHVEYIPKPSHGGNGDNQASPLSHHQPRGIHWEVIVPPVRKRKKIIL